MKTLALIIFACALLLAGPVWADPPATSSTPELVRQRMEKLSVDLSSADAGVRSAAIKTLDVLQRTMIESLTSHMNDRDPEVRARVAALLAEFQRQIRTTRAMACLSDTQRQRLASLQESHQEYCQAMFGTGKQLKLSVLKDISRKVDRQKIYEPLVILGLYSQFEDVQLAAIDAVVQSGYDNPQLAARLVELSYSPGNVQNYGYNPYNPYGVNNLQAQALAALQKIRSLDTAAPLTAIAFSLMNDYSGRQAQLADTAAQTGNLRLLPTLLPKLAETAITRSMSNGVSRISYTNADLALYIMVTVTGQSVEDYNICSTPINSGYNSMGFDSNEKRMDAIKRFREWWDKNKDLPKYKDLKPLVLPDVNHNTGSDTID